MNIILHDAVLVFDQISVELMIMETAIVFQIIRVTLDIYIFDQLRELAFIRSFRYLSVTILSLSIVVIKHTRLSRHSIVACAVGSLRKDTVSTIFLNSTPAFPFIQDQEWTQTP